MSSPREELLKKINIVDFISKYVKLEKRGENYIGLSPFKTEKTPSFSVNERLNIFKDFSSGYGGDVIKFYALINNIEYSEALNDLSKEYGLVVTKSYQDKNKKKLISVLEKAHKIYQEELEKNDFAKEYLKKRGYSLEEARRFGIGYANSNYDQIKNALEDVEKKLLVNLGLLSETGKDIYNNRLIFPIYDQFNNLIAFGARKVFETDAGPKYINSKDTELFKKSNEVYSIKNYSTNIKKDDGILLVEGYFDVLTCVKSGLISTIATLGTSLTENQAKKLSKFSKNIILAYDNDEAGKNATIKNIEELIKHDFSIKCFVSSKDTKDADEYINKYGIEEFFQDIKDSKPVIEYLFNEYLGNDKLTLTKKYQIITKFKSFFKNVSNKLFFNEYIKKLSTLLDIDISILQENFKQKLTQKSNSGYNDISKQTKVASLLEHKIFQHILRHPESINDFNIFEFNDPNNLIIIEKIKNNENILEDQILLIENMPKAADEKLERYDLLKKYIYDYISDAFNKQKNKLLDLDEAKEQKLVLEKIKILRTLNSSKSIQDLKDCYYDFIKRGGILFGEK